MNELASSDTAAFNKAVKEEANKQNQIEIERGKKLDEIIKKFEESIDGLKEHKSRIDEKNEKLKIEYEQKLVQKEQEFKDKLASKAEELKNGEKIICFRKLFKTFLKHYYFCTHVETHNRYFQRRIYFYNRTIFNRFFNRNGFSFN